LTRAIEQKEAAMSKQEVERIDDLGIGAWDSHKADAFADLFADSFVWNDVSIEQPMRTRQEAIQYAQAWFTAFPDMRVTSKRRIVTDDEVAGEIEFTGTNSGPMLMGGNEIPPTGRKITGKGVYFARVQGGKIVQFDSYPDIAGVMMQLGLIGA
jgi:steroid delta-isomerase-like uncharacterized protein